MLFVLYRNMCIDARDFEFIFFPAGWRESVSSRVKPFHRELNPTEAQLGCVISAIAAGHRLVTG